MAEAVLSLGFPLRRQAQVQEPSTSTGLPAASGTRGGGALFSGEGPGTSCVNHSQMGASRSFPPAPALGGVSWAEGSTSPSSRSPHLLLLWGVFPGQWGALPQLPGAPTCSCSGGRFLGSGEHFPIFREPPPAPALGGVSWAEGSTSPSSGSPRPGALMLLTLSPPLGTPPPVQVSQTPAPCLGLPWGGAGAGSVFRWGPGHPRVSAEAGHTDRSAGVPTPCPQVCACLHTHLRVLPRGGPAFGADTGRAWHVPVQGHRWPTGPPLDLDP